MDAPVLADQVGWFSLGTKPGQAGNAVLDGHLDTALETHGVFWNLSAVAPGDDLYVLDAQKHALHFRVRTSVSYPVAAVPMRTIFGASSGAHLNIITCAGRWDSHAGGYAKRLVVFADLIH
jgi:sortase (surface protein transpeptidase)